MSRKSWHLSSTAKFSVGQRSVAGIKPVNEDAIGIRIPEGTLASTKGAVAIIADGVSAAEAGKEASETCVRSFLSDYYSTPDTWSVKKSTTQILTSLNRWLFRQGQVFTDASKGYVCTLSLVVIKSQTAYLFHVGDTRIYRLRAGVFEQLTRDHTVFVAKDQQYLARAMGLDVRLDVDCRTVGIEAGDVFFLSTDGVHDFLTDEYLREMLLAGVEDYEACCAGIIDAALENHSNDNLSCQILRVDTMPDASVNDTVQKLNDLPFPPDLEVGQILDGYRVEQVLHASNRSQVYKVVDVDTGIAYCMKTPSVNFEDDASYIERFIMESWIGSRIRSPYVVKVIDANKPKSALYYLTEFIEGQSLETWIRENPKPDVQVVMHLVEQIVKGTRAFHRRETLHQDLKPGNIMIDNNGEVKIVDFGSCSVKSIAEIANPIKQDAVLGTAGYSAPEAVLSGKCSTQSDIFSLGVIVFEMLTGTEPFSGKLNDCRSAKSYLATRYKPTWEYNPLVPYWIDGAIRKALRYDPARRFNDVSEFLYELQTPNPKYQQHNKAALIDRNPVRFWQGLSFILLIALCISLFYNARA